MASPEKAVVYCIKHEPFKGTIELDEIIDSLDESRVSRVPAYMPKGGEVYIYGWEKNNEEARARWRCDHHRWRQYGGRGFPFSNSKYFKEFSSITLEDGTWSNLFQRITFAPLDLNYSVIIIHYVGDHTLSKVPYRYIPRVREPRRAPFEDLRKDKRTPKKIRVAPLKPGSSFKFKKSMKTKKFDPAKNHYQQSLQTLSDATQSKVLGWLNLKGLAQHLEGFIHRLTVIPVTMCICGSLSMTEEFTKILDLQSTQPQILWFGNTKKVDDYFITPLMFRHLLLEGSPLMPLLFAIHDERFENCASEILLHVVNHIPQLVSLDIPIVVERNVSKFVSQSLPRARIIHTWGHIREEARRWAKVNGFRDLSQFSMQLPEFLDCKTSEQYDSLIENYRDMWPDNWIQFFIDDLTPDIKEHSARWVLEELGVFSSFTGVISQVCEGYDTVIEGFQSLDYITVDMLVLAFHYLHNYLIRQARIAQCGLPCGFNIKREFREALREETEITVPENSVLPVNIVETIRQQFRSVVSEDVVQYNQREYVAQKIEPVQVLDTTIEDERKDVILIETVENAGDNVIETIEIPNDIQQLTQQTGLQRSLINGKLFHTYPRSSDNSF